MSILVEDFDLEGLLRSDSNIVKPSASTSSLFERRFPPQLDLSKLTQLNAYSTDQNYQVIVNMLQGWNRTARQGMMEGGWRRQYHTHLFLYNSAMAALLENPSIGRRNLKSVVDWLNAGRLRQLHPKKQPQLAPTKTNDDELVRKTFKSSLPASLHQMTNRRLFHNAELQSSQSGRKTSAVTPNNEPAGSHVDLRLYHSHCNQLREEREQEELAHLKEKLLARKTILLEKVRNTSLLQDTPKTIKAKQNPLQETEALQKMRELGRRLRATKLSRLYLAVDGMHRTDSTTTKGQDATAQVPAVQGLTLLKNPLIRKKQTRLR